MTRKIHGSMIVYAVAVLCAAGGVAFGEGPGATGPAAGLKTGAFDVKFAQRSPLSGQAELGRRMKLTLAAMGKDYDLSSRLFKIYVPTNYDAATPCGLIVYLGYKDSVSTPPLWDELLNEHHLIFITPVCHSGNQYPNGVPMWQSVGLALDAVYNLKKEYAIDPKRIYLMDFNNFATLEALATADVFTGSVIIYDLSYYHRLVMSNGEYYIEPTFALPPAPLTEMARREPMFFADTGDASYDEQMALKIRTMREDGFAHLMEMTLNNMGDVHYPMFKAEWFEEKALPFLNGASRAAIVPIGHESKTAAAPAPSEAQQLLTMAQLYMNGGDNDAAKTKLQEIIDNYPNDPAAAKAKALLQQLNGQ
ncbi:MAG TPA: tetratricopeptide repeat protein [Tepidisphaeraceae bacterium]|nr:tetratricopeptide repeat protein [Tepidisphaeraceae bacterium]